MKRFLTFALLALLAFVPVACIETRSSIDPCADMRETWCPVAFTVESDPTNQCYCPCSGHDICQTSNVPGSLCGVLLERQDDGSLARAFPESFPYVCRISTGPDGDGTIPVQ